MIINTPKKHSRMLSDENRSMYSYFFERSTATEAYNEHINNYYQLKNIRFTKYVDLLYCNNIYTCRSGMSCICDTLTEHTRTHTHTYRYTHTHSNTHAHIHTLTHTLTHTLIHIHTHLLYKHTRTHSNQELMSRPKGGEGAYNLRISVW